MNQPERYEPRDLKQLPGFDPCPVDSLEREVSPVDGEENWSVN